MRFRPAAERSCQLGSSARQLGTLLQNCAIKNQGGAQARRLPCVQRWEVLGRLREAALEAVLQLPVIPREPSRLVQLFYLVLRCPRDAIDERLELVEPEVVATFLRQRAVLDRKHIQHEPDAPA